MPKTKQFYFKHEKELKKYFKTDTSFRSWLTSWHAWNVTERKGILKQIEENNWDEALKKVKTELKRKKPI